MTLTRRDNCRSRCCAGRENPSPVHLRVQSLQCSYGLLHSKAALSGFVSTGRCVFTLAQTRKLELSKPAFVPSHDVLSVAREWKQEAIALQCRRHYRACPAWPRGMKTLWSCIAVNAAAWAEGRRKVAAQPPPSCSNSGAIPMQGRRGRISWRHSLRRELSDRFQRPWSECMAPAARSKT